MGGIGPTHDDLTMRGVAAGLGVGMEHSTAMEHFLHKFKRNVVTGGEKAGLESLSCQTQRMCMLPVGTELLMEESKEWPLLRCQNVFMLPGVPKFLRQQIAHVGRILGCHVILATHNVLHSFYLPLITCYTRLTCTRCWSISSWLAFYV